MNIFEGSRRIAKIVAAIWIIGWICVLFGYAHWIYKHECITVISPDQVTNSSILCGGYGELKNQKYTSYLLDEIDGGAFLAVVGFLLFIWGFTWAMGYIVRGFKGVPKGQDEKYEHDNYF